MGWCPVPANEWFFTPGNVTGVCGIADKCDHSEGLSPLGTLLRREGGGKRAPEPLARAAVLFFFGRVGSRGDNRNSWFVMNSLLAYRMLGGINCSAPEPNTS